MVNYFVLLLLLLLLLLIKRPKLSNHVSLETKAYPEVMFRH